MGRGRLRRGYSLEVIFEEDPDFCSHLDSLDSVAIRFGVKEADDTISVDSLVEEYQIRFQARADKEHVFRSLDGIWDVKDMDSCFVEWDEFSTDSISKMPPGAGNFESHKSTKLDGDVEIPTNGRRSRVSRRQIVEASWVFDSSDDTENDSGSGNDDKDKDYPPEPEIQPVLVHQDSPNDPSTSTARFDLGVPIDIRLSNRGGGGGEEDTKDFSPPRAIFGNMTRIVDGAEKDTLDSYISTRTDDTEANAYTFADPFNDTASVASTAYESSASTSSSGSVCTVNLRSTSSTPKSSSPPSSKFRSNLSLELQSRFNKEIESKVGKMSPCNYSKTPSPSSQPMSPAGIIGSTEVKRVRALFETPSTSRKSSVGEESSSSSSSGRLYYKNPASPTNSVNSVGSGGSGGVIKKLRAAGGGISNTNQIVGKLRSAFSQINLQQPVVDFGDILVNDKVVIEDNPDLFQLRSNNRHKNLKPSDFNYGGFSTLRRSRSMGTGISTIEPPSPLDKLSGNKTSRSILAEEMPAPDTVKNVRTVFEQILKMRTSPTDPSSTAATPTTTPNGPNCLQSIPPNFYPGGGGNSISIIKKSLSSIKSNPTSKIYRSESMRDDFPSLSCRRFAKPLGPPEEPLVRKHPVVQRKLSEPIKFSPKINSPVSRHPTTSIPPLTEEELSMSLLSSINDDDNPPKFVSPDVLQRIRSCGTTTTYFGGQVIAQSVNNRKLPVNRRHTLDFFHQGEDYYLSPSSNENTPTPTKEEYFNHTPSSVQISHTAKVEEQEPQKRKCQPRLNPMELDEVFGLGKIDTKPRIISVMPKSPSGSPSKSNSPVGSIIEGRGTPEGSEGLEEHRQWINEEIPIELEEKSKCQDGNNNEIGPKEQVIVDKKFSQVAEGAWF